MGCLRCGHNKQCTCKEKKGTVQNMENSAMIKNKLTGTLIGLARVIEGREHLAGKETGKLVVEGLFATLTNVVYDNQALLNLLEQVEHEQKRLLFHSNERDEDEIYNYDMIQLWNAHVDIRSLKTMILLGIRGMAAYAYYADILGKQDEEIYQFLYKALRIIAADDLKIEDLFEFALMVGRENLKCMEMFQEANEDKMNYKDSEKSIKLLDQSVIEAVKAGRIKQFFLVAGCDGVRTGRNYYTEFVERTPKDSIVLTLECGTSPYAHLKLGTVAKLPRLMEIGRCNDAYTAIQIAKELAEATGCSINELPISMVLSWYEQKAVCVLLTLLYLGVKNIRLGPSVPTYLSPNVLNYLVKKYNLALITTPEEDLRAIS